MRVIACSGAGFLVAVLWFDLMFDVQVRGARGDAPAEALASISAYYARVVTAARPMNRLVAAVMLITVASLAGEVAQRDLSAWRSVPSLALTLAAVGLAGARTVRNAARLGSARDDDAGQARIARLVLRDHLACIAAVGSVLVLQLLPA